jgi:hypothetical protein
LEEFSKQYARFSESEIGKAYDERVDAGEPPTSEQIAAIREILEKYPDVTAGLSAAAACEKYASRADFSVDHVKFIDDYIKKQVGHTRTLSRFAQWRVEVLLAEGKQEEAVQQGIEMMRIVRLYDAEPLLINYLVALAIRGITVNMLYDALAAGPVKPELYDELEKELAKHDTPQRLVHALKTDRAYSASLVEEGGAIPGMGADRPFYFGLVAWPMKRFFAGAMDGFSQEIVLAEKSWPYMSNQVGRYGNATSGLGVLADLLLPAIQAAYDAEARVVGMMRSLRIFNALARFRTENEREAAGLAELDLPAAATIDPSSRKPLLLKHTPDGWVVYSVMKDGADNGGDFKGMKDYGVAPRKLRQTE